MQTNGNTVLITGGGSGIGLALAALLVEHQNQVIIVGRNSQRLAKAKCDHQGLQTIQADVTDECDRQRLLQAIHDGYPDLNVLINNAGVSYICDPHGNPEFYEHLRLEMETNYLGPVRLIDLFLPILMQQPSAAVVNVSTPAAYIPLTVCPGYTASKAALHFYTRTLRRHLHGSPVKIFEVLPPPVDTAFVARFKMNKLTPHECAKTIIRGFRADRYEMPIGIANVARWMSRLAPNFCEGLLHKQMLKATQ